MSYAKLSVVMSVYNEEQRLAGTIDSVLAQSFADFEFIIVDDGSTDASAAIIRDYAERDQRIRAVTLENGGLTQALIHGCALARSKYIARQDAGDVSLQNRLKQQIAHLDGDSTIVMSSVGTAFLAPDGEQYRSVVQDERSAQHGLKTLSADTIEGPSHHGAVMFRAEAYSQVGGYRAEFLVAQDIDLWTRMIELGRHSAIPKVYYHAVSDAGSISATKRHKQRKVTDFILRCHHARLNGESDEPILQELRDYNSNSSENDRSSSAPKHEFYYFIASMLASHNKSSARKYLRLAIKHQPFYWRAWIKLLMI